MKKLPLVSVICLNHNQGEYLKEAIDSVFEQNYPSIELILIDDGSKETDKEYINNLRKKYSFFDYINIPEPVGNCKAFNYGLQKASGKYIIDLAADDILTNNRILKQVERFESLPSDYGVIYTDAWFIDKDSQITGYYKPQKTCKGNIYKDIVLSYFISAPTMIFKKNMLDELGGYDENLAYEDFDIWVRSARNYKYDYIPEALTYRRILKSAQHKKFLKKQNPMLNTNYEVCKKIKHLNKTSDEDIALYTRLKYEIEQALFTEHYELVKQYYHLQKDIKTEKNNVYFQFLYLLALLKPPLFPFYSIYHKAKGNK